MPSLSSLGTFLILSFLLPGVIIFSALILLFPDAYFIVEKRSTLELAALVLVISFLDGHLPFIFEIRVLNYIWNKMYPSLDLLNRGKIMQERSRIVAAAEVNGFSHQHFDAIFGEFVLYTNSSLWIFVISFIKICTSRTLGDFVEAALAMVGSLVILSFTSPFFKHQYISALETIRANNDLRQALALSSQGLAAEPKRLNEADGKEQSGAQPEAADSTKRQPDIEETHVPAPTAGN